MAYINVKNNVDIYEENNTATADSSNKIYSSTSNTTLENNNTNLNTSSYQTPTPSNRITEEVDLGAEIEPSSGGILTGGRNFFVGGIKSIGKSISETAANVSSNAKVLSGAIHESFGNGIGSVASTGAVIALSAGSSVLDVGESLVDGALWGVGKIEQGALSIASGAAKVFSEETSEKIDTIKDKRRDNKKYLSSKQMVDHLSEWFYEETPVGKYINENSTIKYNDELATNMRNATEKAAEFAAATGIVVATAAACAPMIVSVSLTAGAGALVGIGKSADQTYSQVGANSTALQELGILGSGALNGLSWLAKGKLGKGFVDIGKEAAAKGTKHVLNGLTKDIVTTDFWKKALADGVTGLNGAGNAVSSVMMTGDKIIPYVNGEKEWSTEAVTELALTLVANFGLNIAEDALRGYVTSFDPASLGQLSENNRIKETADKAIKELGKTSIISRNVNSDLLDGDPNSMPVEYLIKVIKDPNYEKVLLDGMDSTYGLSGKLAEVDGYSKLEIANALRTLKRKVNIDLDEQEINRMNNIIDNLSGDPTEVLGEEAVSLYRKLGKWDGSTPLSSSESNCLRLLSELNDTGYEIDFPNGRNSSDLYKFSSIFFVYALKDNVGAKIDSSELNVFLKILEKDFLNTNHPNAPVDYGEVLKNMITANPGIKVSEKYQTLCGELLKAAELRGYDEETYKILKEFTDGLVPEEKLQNIIGSCIYQTSDLFKSELLAKQLNPNFIGYNNGKKSVVSLERILGEVKATINHESIHHISYGGWMKGNRFNRTLSGVCNYTYDKTTGEWFEQRLGLNECITELFSKLSLGEDAGTSGYDDGVEKLKNLIDLEIINIDDLKKFYFTNDGEGLVRAIGNETGMLGIGDISEDIVKAFDDIISDDYDIAKRGTKALNKIIRIIAGQRIYY